MARLQILELPEGSGDDRPPFLLVVDQVPSDETKFDAIRRDLLSDGDLAPRLGARAVLVFEETIDIPAHSAACESEQADASREDARARTLEAKLKAAFDLAAGFEKQLDEARQWARHGYEIGQRHCSWSDHGVAPAWLTEGWPRHFDSCEHLQQAAAFDEALTRVRNLSTTPEIMNAQQEHPNVWKHGYECGVRAAKSAARPRDEKASGS